MSGGALVWPVPGDRRGRFCERYTRCVAMANRNYVPIIEWHLGSDPEPVVFGNRAGLIVEHAEITGWSSLANDHPHSLHGRALITLRRDFKDQLGKIAGLKDFS